MENGHHPPHEDLPRKGERWKFEGNGLHVSVLDRTNLDYGDYLRDIRTQGAIKVDDGDLIGEMHFTPYGNLNFDEENFSPYESNHFNPDYRIYNLAEMVRAGRNLLSALDKTDAVPKVVLGGTRDPQMVRFAHEKLGFEVLDLAPELPDGEVGKEYLLIGETAKVRERFDTMASERVLDKLAGFSEPSTQDKDVPLTIAGQTEVRARVDDDRGVLTIGGTDAESSLHTQHEANAEPPGITFVDDGVEHTVNERDNATTETQDYQQERD